MGDVVDLPSTPRVKKESLKTYQWLPVTGGQFQDLVNQFLLHFNEDVMDEGLALEADFMAQILIGEIHSIEKGQGKVYLEKLFEGCVGRISKQLTYNIGVDLQARLKKAEGNTTEPNAANLPDPEDAVLPDEVTGADMVPPPEQPE
jgi:hypothetical protein